MNTETDFDIENYSPIELTQELKKSSLRIQKLQAERSSMHPTSPEHFIREAEIELELDQLKALRTSIGKKLLQHDQQLQKRQQDRAIEAGEQVDTLVDSHLEKLAAWTQKASLLSDLASDFEELLADAKRIQTLNSVAAKGGAAKPLGGIVPKNHIQRLRKTLIAAFGTTPIADVNPVRDAPARAFDLVADVEEVIQRIAKAG